MEYETTVSLVFGGALFNRIHGLLEHRLCTEEDLDVYNCCDQSVTRDENGGYKYRELKQLSPHGTRTSWDRKQVKLFKELQVPHIDPATGRVIFVTTTYKASTEEIMTESQWKLAVRENHSNTACIRSTNKHRLSYPPESFTDLFHGQVPEFTRLSLGEYSTYGGTLEARTKCDPVYYLEIESEYTTELEGSEEIRRNAERIINILFTVLPYDLVASTMRNDAAATVRRERPDNIFDEFRRWFVNYNRLRGDLWLAATDDLKLFLMPKWHGVKAIANYCNGFLFIRDACGALSTYRVDLPFDNDLMLQLEIVDEAGAKLYVVTEVLAVVVKTHNTLYHVYSRNNTLEDTGRCAGKMDSTSVTIKTQFNNPNNRCNTYRLVDPLYSLLVMHFLNGDRPPAGERGYKELYAVNTYTRSDAPALIFTSVALAVKAEEISRLRNWETFNQSVGWSRRTKRRKDCLRRRANYFPPHFQKNPRFANLCEGLLVAFVFPDRSPHPPPSSAARRLPSLPGHGYIKIKLLDTVDLEYHIRLGVAFSASGKHRFRVRGVPATFSGSFDRPYPVVNNRVIIECYRDRDLNCMVFLKDRPDKNKADGDDKITAIDDEIIVLYHRNATSDQQNSHGPHQAIWIGSNLKEQILDFGGVPRPGHHPTPPKLDVHRPLTRDDWTSDTMRRQELKIFVINRVWGIIIFGFHTQRPMVYGTIQ
ncbi:hypothetical protein J6590_096377 [Homalodisca vitripennis]|nr:hypothetical protein J6590_096377 [Homalodisca vitripennis]